jgi:hypothetical protein
MDVSDAVHAQGGLCDGMHRHLAVVQPMPHVAHAAGLAGFLQHEHQGQRNVS